MIPYLFIIFLSFVLAGLDFFQLRKVDKIWFFIGFISLLVLFSSLRPAGIDRDYEAYRMAYGYMHYFEWRNILSAYSTYQMEFGYIFLTKLFSSLGFSFGGFLFFYELISGIFLGVLIYKRSPFPLISLCLYVCLFYFLRDFTQIRFAFSCVLLLTGLFMFSDNNKPMGLVYLILAGLLHNSAWIGLLVPLCYYVCFNRWIYLLFPLFGYVISFFHPIKIILHAIGLPEQITRYFNTTTDVGAGVMSYLFSYGLLILSVFNFEKLKELFGAKFEYGYISLSLSVFIGLMFINFPIMQRISGALFTISIFFVPYIIKMFAEKKWYGYRDVLALGIVMVFLFYGVRLILIARILKPYF